MRGTTYDLSMARTPAEALLREVLADGEPHPSVEVTALAQARGINSRSLDRARAKLNVIAKKDGVRGAWSMQLNAAPTKNQTASVYSIWPEYKHIVCDTCEYYVLDAAQSYPHRCTCGGTLDVANSQPRPTPSSAASRI
jgi:hypothetical protein